MTVYTINSKPARPAGRSPTPPKKKPTNRRALIAGIFGGILFVGVSGWWWMNRPPGPNGDPKAVAKYMASPAFASLSDGDRQPYEQAMRDLDPDTRRAMRDSLSQDEQDRLRSQFWHERLAERIKEWQSLKTQEERDAYLDKILAAMAQRRANRPTTQPAGQGPNSANAQRAAQRGTAEAQKMRNETTTPQDKQFMAQFRSALSARATQTGVSMPTRGF